MPRSSCGHVWPRAALLLRGGVRCWDGGLPVRQRSPKPPPGHGARTGRQQGAGWLCQGTSLGWPRGEEQRRVTLPLWGCVGVAWLCLQVWDSTEKSPGDLLTFLKLELMLIHPASESLQEVVKIKQV